MTKEQLREFEPFFGGYLVYDEIIKNDDYTSYRVKKQSPDGKVHYAVLRCYSFRCDSSSVGTSSYPAKLKRLIADTDMMMRLQNCANIVKFYEKSVLTTADGYEFLILMQDISPLIQKERIEALPKLEAYAVASAVCEALVSFRSLGIVHRKICPENIFIDSTGGYLLGDYGIGGTYIAHEDFTSPEEYRVSDDIFSADVYQTGILLYKLLNKNRAPFLPAYPTEITAENRKNAFMRRMNGEIPSSFENSNPEEEEIIKKACAFSPADRYRNVSTFKSDIDALIKELSPTEKHDYYAVFNPAYNEAEIPEENDNYVELEEEITDSTADPVYQQYIASLNAKKETDKMMTALIVSISLIAVMAAIFVIYMVVSGKKSNQNVQPSTEITTTAPTTAAPTTAPTTETTTEPTTVPTTVPTTSTTVPVTTQATTAAQTEFTLPENFSLSVSTEPAVTQKVNVDPSSAELTFYEDNERIDEIVVSIKENFGENISANDDIILCEYSGGKLLRTVNVPTSCMYDDDSQSTLCDIHIPEDFEIDVTENSYRIIFPDKIITGKGYESSEFAVDFDATSFN